MIDYFQAIREEVFFLAVRDRMQLSTIAIKERYASSFCCNPLLLLGVYHAHYADFLHRYILLTKFQYEFAYVTYTCTRRGRNFTCQALILVINTNKILQVVSMIN